jgi:hypothetical protein
MCSCSEGTVLSYLRFLECHKTSIIFIYLEEYPFDRELLVHGIQWGTGDGRSVKILKDSWIPHIDPVTIMPTSPIPDTTTVHCLIDEDTGSWNEENVNGFFQPSVANRILQVPISQHAGED